jgi:DNA replication protein DnaC
MGEYSQGKSAIAAICLKAAACQGIIGFWVSSRFLTEYKIEKTRFDDMQTIWERACVAPLVVLDEVQLRKEAKYGEQALEDLIRCRIENKRCTIVTTNHGKGEWVKRAPSLLAVVKEAMLPVVVMGHDFRKELAEGLA